MSQQFYVGPDYLVIHDVFLSVFWWIYCYNKRGQEHTLSSRYFGLSGPSSVSVVEAETSRRKRVLLPILYCNNTCKTTKVTEEYIKDDEAVRSNIKLLTLQYVHIELISEKSE